LFAGLRPPEIRPYSLYSVKGLLIASVRAVFFEKAEIPRRIHPAGGSSGILKAAQNFFQKSTSFFGENHVNNKTWVSQTKNSTQRRNSALKRMFALLLTALLATASLTGCGTTTDKNTTGNGSGSTATDQTGSTTSNTAAKNTTAGIAGTTGTVKNSRTIGNTGTVTNGRTVTNTGAVRNTTAATNQRSLVRGATYEQMLRNGYVHDTDGNLRDYENAVTPGTAY
jgi:hypothetical protein